MKKTVQRAKVSRPTCENMHRLNERAYTPTHKSDKCATNAHIIHARIMGHMCDSAGVGVKRSVGGERVGYRAHRLQVDDDTMTARNELIYAVMLPAIFLGISCGIETSIISLLLGCIIRAHAKRFAMSTKEKKTPRKKSGKCFV